MASLGRIVNSLGTAVNENTVALANINFDFTLVRQEAPREYQRLGQQLSPQRRKEAEEGGAHKTARRLRALFDGVVIHTPKLFAAYGLRVSEISQSSNLNPEGTTQYGPFASRVGADGTAIWAAATSGKCALSMLLLAAMLARLWEPAEAISLWVELVACRRAEIQRSSEEFDDVEFQKTQAARQEISRNELADWDASARAWLQTADQARLRQQTQLDLIVNNLNIPMSTHLLTYSSLIENMNIALECMEDLLSGRPQSVQHGAFLLGLQSWHIYPDMVVHQEKISEIRQNDLLVPEGAILTLGLSSEREDVRGVCWSLPLAHLRYYGGPINRTRTTGHDASRISPELFAHVVLGMLARRWVEDVDDIEFMVRWFVDLRSTLETVLTKDQDSDENLTDCISEASQADKICAKKLLHDSGWISALMKAAKTFVEAEGLENQQCRKLIAIGFQRLSKVFLGTKNDVSEGFFGLDNPRRAFDIVHDEEAWIAVLQNFANNNLDDDGSYIIRYQFSYTDDQSRDIFKRSSADAAGRSVADSSVQKAYFEYVTAHQVQLQKSAKRTRKRVKIQPMSHQRWIGMQRDHEDIFASRDLSSCVCSGPCQLFDCLCASTVSGCSDACPCQISEQKCKINDSLSKLRSFESQRAFAIKSRFKNFCIAQGLESIVAYCNRDLRHYLEKRNIGNRLYNSTWKAIEPSSEIYLENAPWSSYLPGPVSLTFVFGDPERAAIYKAHPREEPPTVPLVPSRLGVANFEPIFQHRSINIKALYEHFQSLAIQAHSNDVRSLRAFATIMDIYKLLPEATFKLSVGEKDLSNTSWVKSATSRETPNLGDPWRIDISLAETFSAIIMFDTGHDIEPSKLDKVFAISSGNSIFVAAPLLCDPYESPTRYEVRRIVGNVGRAGIALLIPPISPMVRPILLDHWELMNNARFDGTMEDQFSCTSLHLKFTNSSLPLYLNGLGAQDSGGIYLESLIQVHDRHGWVADLDVLGALQSHLLSRYPVVPCARSHPKAIPKLIAVDNWYELISCEEPHHIVRAHQNWCARLAATVVAIQMGHSVEIHQGQVCWFCHSTITRGIKLIIIA